MTAKRNQQPVQADAKQDEGFETLYSRLEETVEKLERGGLSLEESITLYEEGMTLAKSCQAILDGAEQRITKLRDSFAQTAGDEAPAPTRDIMGEKVENWAAAFIESIAEMRDRNVEWAAEAVRKSVAITQKEAVELNVVDMVAEDLAHVLELVDGRKVIVGRTEVVLETAGAPIQRVEMDLVNRFFDVISHPNITVILILAGLGGVFLATRGARARGRSVLAEEHSDRPTETSTPALKGLADRAIELADRSLQGERGGRLNQQLDEAGVSMRPASRVPGQ